MVSFMDIRKQYPPPVRTRQNELLLRLNDEESAALDAVAEARGTSRSVTLRALILEAAPPAKRRRSRTPAAGTGR